jgi:hypothetical protein
MAIVLTFLHFAPRWVRLVICCAFLFSRCSNEAEQSPSVKPLPGRARAELYESRQHSETTAVIRTQATWELLWRRAGRGPLPEIDFEREMLVVAGLGMGGWDRDVSIWIDGARPDGLVALVHVRHSVPQLCGRDASRAPVEIVRVARDPRPVVFQQRVEHLNCGRR